MKRKKIVFYSMYRLIAMLILISLRRRHYLTRKSLNTTKESGWRVMLSEKNNLAFMNTMGLHYAAFMDLWDKFKLVLPLKQGRYGRKRDFSSKDVLGLVLFWLNSPIRQNNLSQIFGLVPSALTTYLWKGMKALLNVLQNVTEIQVLWPDEAEMAECSKLVERREPLLKTSFGFVDGLNIPVLQSSDSDIQNAYYNGWLSGCYVSNVFVFSAKGKIIYAAINKPGSWHDSNVARSLYDKLRWETPGNYNILADSAFSYTNDIAQNILAVI